MWSLGPHCHSLLSGYRFIDPQWEVEYQARCQQWALPSVRVYMVAALAISIVSLTDFERYFSLKLSLVLHFLICGFSSLLFTSTFCSHFALIQRYILQMFAGCCCFIAICYCCIMVDNIRIWGDFALSHFAPSLESLPEDNVVRTQGEWLIRMQVGSEAAYNILLWSFNHWIVLALLGCNHYTFFSFLVVFISVSSTVFLDSHVFVAIGINVITISTVATGVFFCISVVMERLRRTNFLNEALLTRELQASQMADSMLNHTLKNLLADVAANIEVFLAGAASRSMLEDSVTCLRRGMMACKERQVYLKLVSGEYIPVSHLVNLKEFGQQLAAGRGFRVEAVDLSVYLDSTICNLILENALSNAVRHGHPQRPQVRLIIEILAAEPETRQGFQRIRFTVENAANPDRPPLTAEDVEQLFQGQPHLLSAAQIPTLSDRVGIKHCLIAAQLGGLSLSLYQSGSVVRFCATLDALIVPQPCTRTAFTRLETVSQHFPSGLRFCCIDDSKPALRLLELHLKTWCEPSSVHLFGQNEDDVPNFVPFALEHADVVIIDQHLEYGTTYLGTDLVHQLREKGFDGLVCIRSANDSVEDREWFRREGAHCCFGKDLVGPRMMEELKVAYVQLKGFPSSSLLPEIIVDSESVCSFSVDSGGTQPQFLTRDCSSAPLLP